MLLRSRSWRYSLVALTSGIYAFFWAFQLMRAIESLSAAEKFPIQLYRRVLVWYLAIYFMAIFYGLTHIGPPGSAAFSPVWVLVMALWLWNYMLYLVVKVHRAVGRLNPTRQRRSTSAIVGLTLLFFTSLPVLQTEVDELSANARGRT